MIATKQTARNPPGLDVYRIQTIPSGKLTQGNVVSVLGGNVCSDASIRTVYSLLSLSAPMSSLDLD
jgi:hypothetical protein